MWCLISWVLAFFTIYFLSQLIGKNTQSLYGIYQQKGKWFHLKYIAFYIFLKLRKMNAIPSQDLSGYGTKSVNSVEDMERIQPLGNHSKAVDAVFFTGANRDGYYFAVGFARRQNRFVDGLMMLRIPGMGVLLSPRLPDTNLKADNDDSYSGEGINIEVIKPMRHWRINYQGRMKYARDPQKFVNVTISFDWKTHLHYFDFNIDVSLSALAKAIAREKWSVEFFEDLKKTHQNHYEQMGNLEGRIEIEGSDNYDLRLNSMRDHSYGNIRDWKSFHRYILHNVTVEDGTRFMVGVISIPKSFSVFECGYVYTPSGTLFGVDSCDLPMWFIGEYGDVPTNYGFAFEAGNIAYQVQVEVIESVELYFGSEWEAQIHERMCQFTVNGKKAWGMCEWQYRNYSGKPNIQDN